MPTRKQSRARRQRRHSFVITATFDKPCGRNTALREMRDCIHGDFYCTEYFDGDPGKFANVKIIRRPSRC